MLPYVQFIHTKKDISKNAYFPWKNSKKFEKKMQILINKVKEFCERKKRKNGKINIAFNIPRTIPFSKRQ